MSTPQLSRRQALLWLGAAASPLTASAAKLPGNSVYQLHATLQDQHGRSVGLEVGRGHPVLVSMFYSSCEMVCPMIFETISQTMDRLPDGQAQQVRVLMISFDPERDTVAVLKKTAAAHRCDERWTLARADGEQSRKIAAVLGVQYRRLESGEYSHSSSIALLDAEGRIAARSAQLGAVDSKLLHALSAQLKG
jgi:protein SCO1/2